LRDCAAFLGDDGRTVTLYAHYSSDDAVSSQFKLPSAVTAEDFDQIITGDCWKNQRKIFNV